MVKARHDGLVQVSVVLTRRQWEQIRAIAGLRKTETHQPSLSEITREVVALGLAALLRAPDSSLATTGQTEEAA